MLTGVKKFTVEGMEKEGARAKEGEKGRNVGRDGRGRRRKE